jgi:hypothetical protein
VVGLDGYELRFPHSIGTLDFDSIGPIVLMMNVLTKRTFPDLAALGKQLNPAIDTLFMQWNLIPINP